MEDGEMIWSVIALLFVIWFIGCSSPVAHALNM